MRRTFSPSIALLAGLVTLLAGCAGESPTGFDGQGGTGGAGGTGQPGCNVAITLSPSSYTPVAGTYVAIHAVVKKNGSNAPDGTSVQFTTDFGAFAETGFNSVSKVILDGAADVTLFSQYGGPAHVKATYECGTQPLLVTFSSAQQQGPFISSVLPTTGSCTGGDTVVITGQKFLSNGNTQATTRVTFGGTPGTVQSVSDTQIVVKTPARSLANPAIPEHVDIVVTLAGSAPITWAYNPNDPNNSGFTYACIAPGNVMNITSVVPNSGKPEGNDTVVINGNNFGTSVAGTRVTFGGVAASIQSVTNNAITVLTPPHPLANATVPETVDVAVTRDLGLATQQTAVKPNAFTYRASGINGACPPNPGLVISSVQPNTGGPEGGTVVTLQGSGFGTSIANTTVSFGGVLGSVLSVAPNTITVSSPRFTLGNPDVPQTVDIVVTTDVGGPNCASALAANGFTFTRLALQPIIYSISPSTGPNDIATRVTIRGTGFQFPVQVFMTSSACGGAKLEAAVIGTPTLEQIVFQTPIAMNGNACLANSLASVTVVNWNTGKTSDPYVGFKYYECPTVGGATPQFGPYNTTTSVIINGQNFPEQAQAVWRPSGGAVGATQLNVSSVSASAIVVQLPPIDPINVAVGGAACSNLSGTIELTFPTLSCAGPFTTPFTYKIDAPQVQNASPQQVNQNGGQTITVSGAFFSDPMTVQLLKNGTPVANTVVNNPVVSNPNTLTFTSPAIRDGDFNTLNCVPTGGTSPIGTMYVPTSFGIRVTNARTGCSADLPNILTYTPNDTACRLAAAITTTSLPSALLCNPYNAAVAATGTGTLTYGLTMGAGYTGLTIDPATGAISGTPTITTPGPGTATGSFAVTVTVTDTSVPPTTASKTFTVNFTDAIAPYTITGSGTASIPTTGGTSAGSYTTPTSANWTGTINPVPGAGSVGVTPATGTSTQIVVAAGTTPGTYAVTLTATDACGHVATLPVTLTVTP